MRKYSVHQRHNDNSAKDGKRAAKGRRDSETRKSLMKRIDAKYGANRLREELRYYDA